MLNEDVLRLHILANSDSDEDQRLKLAVRDAVISELTQQYKSAQSKEDAINITYANLDKIKEVSQKVVKNSGYDYTVTAGIKKEFFDTRYYDDFTMPAGVYDSLLIEIGDACGKNWWCVMYPSLCVGASSKTSMQEDLCESEYELITTDEYEFRFKIVEIFEKIRLFFL